MKRHQLLQSLSREHQPALSLAVRLKRADAGQAVSVFAQLDQPALLAHFEEEERDWLPLLLADDERPLRERTLAEHRQLRAQLAAISDGDSAQIADFAMTLEAHVRFEERELFPLIERHLPG